jgi:hypothetical protein
MGDQKLAEGGGDDAPPSGAAMAAGKALRRLTLGDLRASKNVP